MTNERLAELHEAAEYALSHGNGQVTVPAKDLIEVLPALPVEDKTAEPVAVAEVVASTPVIPAVAETVPVPPANAPEVAGSGLAPEPEAAPEIPAGAPIVDTQTLSQDEIDATVKWDKDHPTQEEQERAKAAVQPAGPVLVPEAGADPAAVTDAV